MQRVLSQASGQNHKARHILHAKMQSSYPALSSAVGRHLQAGPAALARLFQELSPP